jgi:hypothetical protein
MRHYLEATMFAFGKKKKKKKKNYARISYRHECEPVIPMFNIAGYVVRWGVMPLLGGGLIRVSNLDKVEWLGECVGYFPFFRGVLWGCFWKPNYR